MTRYFIELNISGNMVTIPCDDKEHYEKIAEFLERELPNKEWKERKE